MWEYIRDMEFDKLTFRAQFNVPFKMQVRPTEVIKHAGLWPYSVEI